jgi:hypothetical protein
MGRRQRSRMSGRGLTPAEFSHHVVEWLDALKVVSLAAAALILLLLTLQTVIAEKWGHRDGSPDGDHTPQAPVSTPSDVDPTRAHRLMSAQGRLRNGSCPCAPPATPPEAHGPEAGPSAAAG